MSGNTLIRVTILAPIVISLIASGFSIVSHAKEGKKPVLITDDCEPVSFNLAFQRDRPSSFNAAFIHGCVPR
jgi:hypothetical protein